MKKFGEKDKLQLIYNFKKDPFGESKYFSDSWGTFEIYVKNKDLCRVTMYGETRKYEWNLVYITEWLVYNLEYIIGYDPFPLFQSDKNLNDMLEIACNKEWEDDLEFDLWYGALHTWTRRHAWASESGGSLISNVSFYRRGNKIEITWNNEEERDLRIKYEYKKGTENIERKYFIEVICEFLANITEYLYQKDKNNKTFKELKEKFNFWLRCKENNW